MDVLTPDLLANHENVKAPSFEKSNFLYSFSLLPKEERAAITSVYNFCSYIDDIVDSTPNTNNKAILKKMERLAWWDQEIENLYSGKASGPFMLPFAAVIKRFNLPKQYFLTLIDGCRRDLVQTRYQTIEELKDYCYSVASIVGLISIEIFGYKYDETKNYAVNLGYALQLTNILRDIKVDKDRGYIYLPKEDMDKFGYTEEDVFNEVYNENFIELMRYEARKVREYYFKARASLNTDEKATIIAAEIMDAVYFRLLEKIELNDYNVYAKKIKVSTLHKILITFKHWLSIRMFIERFTKKSTFNTSK